jgi:transposase
MGQRARILTGILGFDGWKVTETFFESATGKRVEAVGGFALLRETRLVLVAERRWLPRCSRCGAACRRVHERLPARRWADLPWAGHPVEIEYAGCRVKCRACESASVEMVAWADPYQRQSRRLQQHLAIEAASMPVMHVAALHGLSWLTVRRAEERALARDERVRLHQLLAQNRILARAYQIKEELREVLAAPDRASMEKGLAHILRRTRSYAVRPLRRLHDTLNERWNEIVALAVHRPATGRVEALNNNWETLVRRARGYRDHDYLLRKLRFMVANPIRTNDGLRRFVALGLTPPMPLGQAA